MGVANAIKNSRLDKITFNIKSSLCSREYYYCSVILRCVR